MAIFHLSAKPISRGQGHSASAAAAYRFGLSLTDARTGLVHDYTRKGGVIGGEVFAPEGAPQWAHSVPELVAQVDAVEKRKDSQVFRELVLALPIELSHDQRRELVADFAASMTRQGMVCAVAYHDTNGRNPHAHMLQTLRPLTPEGFGAKAREWNTPETLQGWREGWASCVNAALAKAAPEAQPVTNKSHKALGRVELPTIHEGHAPQAKAVRVGENERRRAFNASLRASLLGLLGGCVGPLATLFKRWQGSAFAMVAGVRPYAAVVPMEGPRSEPIVVTPYRFVPDPPKPPQKAPVSERIVVTSPNPLALPKTAPAPSKRPRPRF